MKKIFSRDDREALLDKVIEIANITHESGITVAEKLELPEDLLWELRQRSPRAALIGFCGCPECLKNIIKKDQPKEQQGQKRNVNPQ